MALDNPPPHLPDDTASGPAREWLERERQRAEPSTYGFAPARTPKTARPPETKRGKERKTDWRVWSALVLFGSFVVRPIAGWELQLVIFLAAFGAYHYLVRRFRAYRHRRRANQGGALSGGGSEG